MFAFKAIVKWQIAKLINCKRYSFVVHLRIFLLIFDQEYKSEESTICDNNLETNDENMMKI